MDVADELCYELFRLIDQQERCADHLMALATELEGMREAVTKGHLVGNTATVLGSATLVGTGIATVVTGGLAAPMLALAAGITAGAGTVTAVGLSFVQGWKSSAIMKNAEKTADQIKEIQDNIERLQKKLNKECENKLPKTSSSEELQCEFTARILRALAKRSGKDLSISRLKHFISSNDEYYRDSGTNPNIVQILFYPNFGIQYTLFALLGLMVMRRNMSTAVVFETTKMAIGATKTVLKGTGQVFLKYITHTHNCLIFLTFT